MYVFLDLHIVSTGQTLKAGIIFQERPWYCEKVRYCEELSRDQLNLRLCLSVTHRNCSTDFRCITRRMNRKQVFNVKKNILSSMNVLANNLNNILCN